MLKAIQQEVTIQPGGIVTLHSPELQSGLRTNVIFLVPTRWRTLLYISL
jgi:hypothetical protein